MPTGTRSEGVGALVIQRVGAPNIVVSGSAVRRDGRSAIYGAQWLGTMHPAPCCHRPCGVRAAQLACIERMVRYCTVIRPKRGARCGPSSAARASLSAQRSECRSLRSGVRANRAAQLRRLMYDVVTWGNSHLRALNPLVCERLGGVSFVAGLPTQAFKTLDFAPAGVSAFGYSGTIAHCVTRCCNMANHTDIPMLVQFHAGLRLQARLAAACQGIDDNVLHRMTTVKI